MERIIDCLGKNIVISNESGLKSFIKEQESNEKWRGRISTYYESEVTFDNHKKNCTLLSSLNNRVFADYEWDILRDKWDDFRDKFKTVNNIDSIEAATDLYIEITEKGLFPLFKDAWSKKKSEDKKELPVSDNRKPRDYSKPYAEINRLFLGFNQDSLCFIIDDDRIKELIEELVVSQYLSIDEDILSITKENGGWLVRSLVVNKLFNELGFNNKTLPWICLQQLKNKKIRILLEKNKNIILTGAPGTGKTLSAERISESFAGVNGVNGVNYVKKIQFHPSYDYTDFVEGLRPDQSNSFTRKDGVLKKLCKCAILGLLVDTDEKIIECKEKELFENGNSDKPVGEENDQPYVLIIDEINRGEVSKIFGELFFCIERTHRKERRDTQYQNLVPSYDLFAKGFYVPNNVFIIGTMNDIDRSVESLDFAFRRRFAFYEFPVDTDMLNSMTLDPKTIEEVELHMTRLNKELMKEEYGLTSAYQIGGSYFLDFMLYYNQSKYSQRLANTAFNSLWEYHLKGVLYEYFRGLPQKDIEAKMGKLKIAYDGK